MEAPLYQYIKRADGAPCMKPSIKLYAGCTGSSEISRRHKLLTFLRGSKKAEEDLKEEYPRLYSYFEMIWSIRDKHMNKTVPINYIFFLCCCCEDSCPHPLCKGKNFVTISSSRLEVHCAIKLL